ncbi:soluble starch synthase 3, chloroplastic/amyloplastic isoform X2 [Benincasa hispida]|uniref:soluble starch synthase 3, chloroplastic/amyloplastic isoform X2 n=1 Tax=Benincasa hispida TaxID=102211 RepID=UPI0018FFC1C2|nr:soluble starch synthase 3, chloroplastic/amyloplastic isoform X2 [Benincasa hispida]
MEVALQAHVSRSWRTTNFTEAQAGSLRFRLFHGNTASSTTSTTLSPLWFRGHVVAGRSFRIVASARQSDSSRKRSRKLSTARLESSAPKGFKPKVPLGASTPKRDHGSDEEKEGSATLKSSAHTKPNQAAVKLKVGDEEDLAAKVSQEDADVQKMEENDAEIKSSLTSKSTSVGESAAEIDNGMAGRLSGIGQKSLEKEEENEPSEAVSGVLDNSVEDEPLKKEEKLTEEESLKLKLEMEAIAKRHEIKKLAEENLLGGIQVFVFPPVVKPDQNIELFFNRSLSILNGEQDVLIMGAFNDWKWKSFTMRLNKANIDGDWWSCQIHVPKEAYKIDFVFFNGKDVYENNDEKDFCIYVEGGMDASTFEDFLLEEKRKELERLAKERTERERQEEEARRIEAEKVAMAADRDQARADTEKRREMVKQLSKMAAKSVDNVWFIEPTEFQGGDLVRLYYNKNSGPLAHAEELWVHGGHNNWTDGLSIIEKLVFAETKDNCDWWYADVIVPDRALVLDWVLADGLPKKANIYDNNKRLDFHAIVPKAISEELYWVEEERRIYRKLQEERRLREEALRAKVERTARMKSETKERTMKNFLLSQEHIVFTDPVDVQAGSAVTVFYNPANTPLNGKPEVWFRCSFNRWSHRNGPLPPQKMLPADGGSHVKATVKVPLDAYMMDFVFSEREDGGIFDNKNGMDYHIPVVGGISKEPPLHIVHIAVEMAPIAKVGGLGDVVTSLSRAIQDLNHNVDIVLPKYDCLNLSNVENFHHRQNYFWGGTEVKVWFGKVEGLSVYFLEPQNGFFWTGCIYGCANDGERFGFFCHAALEFLLQGGFHPDIIHCHDWSSAPVAWLFKEQYMHYGLTKARVVFTIHNLEFGAQLIGRAMLYSDKATTVSPTYSKEVSGNPVIAPHLHKFHGIVNGIDPDIWDPYNDKFIPVPYTSENVVEGKRAAKEALQQRLGLSRSDLPLVGIITRLTHQKGIHLIKHAIWRTLDRGGQVVLLGSAPDPRIQNDFVNLANQLHSSYPDRARLCLTYDEPLSHLIYAGGDLILVPSIFEPCGLTQLTAMRYGSVPVVRKTGGLYDTVFDVDHDKERAQAAGLEPNGFNFEGADPSGVDYALNRAISAWYNDRSWFHSLCKRVMEQDWSWNRPALDYLELYHAARK